MAKGNPNPVRDETKLRRNGKTPTTAITVRIPEIKKSRALAMLDMRVKGFKLSDIAVKFNCNEDTVTRTLKWAVQQGIVGEAEDRLYDSMLTKAMNAYEKALDDGDVAVATKVLETVGLIRKAKDQNPQKMGIEDGQTNWDSYLQRRAERVVHGLTAPVTIDAEAVVVTTDPTERTASDSQ